VISPPINQQGLRQQLLLEVRYRTLSARASSMISATRNASASETGAGEPLSIADFTNV
jgi:hypothetical protein